MEKDTSKPTLTTVNYNLAKTDTLTLIEPKLYQTVINIYSPNPQEKTLLCIPLDYWQLLIPVITFGLGYLLAYIIKKYEIISKITANKVFLSTWIDLIQDPLTQQIKSYKEFTDSVTKNDDFPGCSKIPLSVEKLKSISDVDMVNTFITNQSGDDKVKTALLHKLSHDIEYLLVYENALEVQYGHFQTFHTNEIAKWNEHLLIKKDLINHLIDHPNNNENNNTENNLYNQIKTLNLLKRADDKIKSLNTDGKKEETISIKNYQTYLDQYENICKNFIDDERALKLLPVVEYMKIIYETIEKNKKNAAEIFKKYIEDLEKTQRELQEINIDIIKMRFKPCYRLK